MSETTPSYTSVDEGTVTLGATTFRVERMYNADGELADTFLHGPRGAVYFLRAYIERNGDSGLRQVISWGSGNPLRRRGNEVKVVEIAGVIEEYKAGAR